MAISTIFAQESLLATKSATASAHSTQAPTAHSSLYSNNPSHGNCSSSSSSCSSGSSSTSMGSATSQGYAPNKMGTLKSMRNLRSWFKEGSSTDVQEVITQLEQLKQEKLVEEQESYHSSFSRYGANTFGVRGSGIGSSSSSSGSGNFATAHSLDKRAATGMGSLGSGSITKSSNRNYAQGITINLGRGVGVVSPQDILDSLVMHLRCNLHRYRSAKVKYRFVDLEGNLCEWSGQGREPIKLRELLAATNQSRDEFLVSVQEAREASIVTPFELELLERIAHNERKGRPCSGGGNDNSAATSTDAAAAVAAAAASESKVATTTVPNSSNVAPQGLDNDLFIASNGLPA